MFRYFFSKKILFNILLCILVCRCAFAENNLLIEVGGEASGKIEITLLPDLAPLHVERIKTLVNSGAYDGVVFHRVIEGFMAQTGDVKFGKTQAFNPELVGRGGSSLPNLPSEFSDMAFVEGTVGMARSQNPNSANSQFFIMFQDGHFLNGNYTVFGKVLSGMDIVDKIKKGDPNKNGMIQKDPDFMNKVIILEN